MTVGDVSGVKGKSPALSSQQAWVPQIQPHGCASAWRVPVPLGKGGKTLLRHISYQEEGRRRREGAAEGGRRRRRRRP